MATLPIYALVAPARNEAQFIELTIKSVVAQDRPVEGFSERVAAIARRMLRDWELELRFRRISGFRSIV